MKICRDCCEPQRDSKDLFCPRCKGIFIEPQELPLSLTSEQLDLIASSVAKTFKDEDLDRIAKHTVKCFERKDWKPLADQVLKSMNIIYHTKHLAYVLMGLWRFWRIFGVVLFVVALSVLAVANWGARKEAKRLFDVTVTNQIELQFKEPRISNLVAEVAANQASNLMWRTISPDITNFEASLAVQLALIQTNLNGIQQEARTNLSELRQQAELYLLIAKAQGDDKASFWQLWDIAANTNNPMREVANRATVAIADGVKLRTGLLSTMQYTSDIWKQTTNSAETASIEQYLLRLNGPITELDKLFLLRQMFSQNRFSLEDRLRLLMSVIKYSNSLILVSEACHLVNGEAKLNKNFLAEHEFLDWYEKWVKDRAAKNQ